MQTEKQPRGELTKKRRQRTSVHLPPLRAGYFSEQSSRCLFFVAVEAVDRRDRAEEAILFAVNAGGEKQSVRWPGVRVVAEREGPEPIDRQDGIVGILDEADEFVREAVERGNLAAAEIAYENGIAELAKVACGPDNSPR